MRNDIVLGVCLVLALVWCSEALSQGELASLKDLGESWNYFNTSSRPWLRDALANACDVPPYYGLVCSEGPDPHVLKLYEWRRATALGVVHPPLKTLLSAVA